MSRRLLLVLLAFAASAPIAAAQTTQQRQPTLRERLVAGLQVRRPSEFEYIDAVIDTVNRGDLSQRLVDRVFFWARSRAASKTGRRGVIYFQPGLDRIAARYGVKIEPNARANRGTS